MDGAPVVYSARGSHASYYRPGIYPQAPVVPDHNDDRGPRLRPSLTAIKGEATPWVAWPGRWGSTRDHGKILGFEIGADSPPGPRGHGSWHDPLKFHREARPAVGLAPVAGEDLARPAAPTITAEREGDRARVSFSFPAADPAAPMRKGILVSLDGAKDGHAPLTQSFATDDAVGQVEFPFDLEDRAYAVRVAGVGENGVTGPAGQFELPAAAAAAPPAG